MADILQCKDLTKEYVAGTPILNRLNLNVSGGQILGLLGPNGCGKSTLLKLISGILVPTDGEILIDGETRSEASNALISYLPERTYFDAKMQVTELLDFFCDFYPDFDRTVAEKMLNDLNIDPKARLKTLSKGTKEKVQLILVMSRRAKLYLLDEPIGGVDPAARDYILGTIIGNYSSDASVIITTHLIADIEPILDSFAFLQNGQIILSGDVDTIREERGMTLDAIFREVFKC